MYERESCKIYWEQKIVETVPVGYGNAISARQIEIDIHEKYHMVPSAVSIALLIKHRLTGYVYRIKDNRFGPGYLYYKRSGCNVRM